MNKLFHVLMNLSFSFHLTWSLFVFEFYCSAADFSVCRGWLPTSESNAEAKELDTGQASGHDLIRPPRATELVTGQA